MEGFSDGGGGPVSSLPLPRSEEEWVCIVRTPDHSQIPYFDTKTKVPDAHSGEGVGGLGGSFTLTWEGTCRTLTGQQSSEKGQVPSPSLSVKWVGGLGSVRGAPSVVDMWGTGGMQLAPSGHFGSSGRSWSLAASLLDIILPTLHSLCLVPGCRDDVRLDLPDLLEGI